MKCTPLSSLCYGLLFRSGLILLVLAISPVSLAAGQGNGHIRLFNYHLDEFAEITYRKDGKPLPAELAKIHRLFRSRDNEEIRKINIRLIDLLDHLQEHFNADTIEIISGYRRKEFNEELRRNGHAVSPVSFHVQGFAADIHIDEIREETLRDYVRSLQVGGVGYYGPFDFVHVDLGEARHWGSTRPFPRKLIGVLEESTSGQLTSDRNEYLPGNTMHFAWTVPAGFDWHTLIDVQLEHFFRGAWHKVAAAPSSVRQKQFVMKTSETLFITSDQTPRYGKYRWTFRIPGHAALLSSNEFYLKKE